MFETKQHAGFNFKQFAQPAPTPEPAPEAEPDAEDLGEFLELAGQQPATPAVEWPARPADQIKKAPVQPAATAPAVTPPAAPTTLAFPRQAPTPQMAPEAEPEETDPAAEDLPELQDVPEAEGQADLDDLTPGVGGLFGHLAGIVGGAGSLHLLVVRSGDTLSVSVMPVAESGEQATSVVPLQLTATPEELDRDFVACLGIYGEARRDAISVARETAARQQTATANARKGAGKAPAKPEPKKEDPKKTEDARQAQKPLLAS